MHVAGENMSFPISAEKGTFMVHPSVKEIDFGYETANDHSSIKSQVVNNLSNTVSNDDSSSLTSSTRVKQEPAEMEHYDGNTSKPLQDTSKHNFSLVLSSICKVKEEPMYCHSCPHSDVNLSRLKFHAFTHHPTKAAVVTTSFGETDHNLHDVRFLCVKVTCGFSTALCNAYEEHLMNCCLSHESLSENERERLASTLKFVLDFHNKHCFSEVGGFLNYVVNFKKTFTFEDDQEPRVNSPCLLGGNNVMRPEDVEQNYIGTSLAPVPTPVFLFTTQNTALTNETTHTGFSDATPTSVSDQERNISGQLKNLCRSNSSERKLILVSSYIDQLVTGSANVEMDVMDKPMDKEYDSLTLEETSVGSFGSRIESCVNNDNNAANMNEIQGLRAEQYQIADILSGRLIPKVVVKRLDAETENISLNLKQEACSKQIDMGSSRKRKRDHFDIVSHGSKQLKNVLSDGDDNDWVESEEEIFCDIEASHLNVPGAFNIKQKGTYLCWICFRKFTYCLAVKVHIIKNHSKAICAIAQYERGNQDSQFQILLFCPRICNFVTTKSDVLSTHIDMCLNADLNSEKQDFVQIQSNLSQTFAKLQALVSSGAMTDMLNEPICPSKSEVGERNRKQPSSEMVSFGNHMDHSKQLNCMEVIAIDEDLDLQTLQTSASSRISGLGKGAHSMQKGSIEDKHNTSGNSFNFQGTMKKAVISDKTSSHDSIPNRLEVLSKDMSSKPDVFPQNTSKSKQIASVSCSDIASDKPNGDLIKDHLERAWFPCDECSKYFRGKARLAEHKKLHLKKQRLPFKCSGCYKDFSWSDYLGHVKAFTGGKPFQCDECGGNVIMTSVK